MSHATGHPMEQVLQVLLRCAAAAALARGLCAHGTASPAYMCGWGRKQALSGSVYTRRLQSGQLHRCVNSSRVTQVGVSADRGSWPGVQGACGVTAAHMALGATFGGGAEECCSCSTSKGRHKHVYGGPPSGHMWQDSCVCSTAGWQALLEWWFSLSLHQERRPWQPGC